MDSNNINIIAQHDSDKIAAPVSSSSPPSLFPPTNNDTKRDRVPPPDCSRTLNSKQRRQQRRNKAKYQQKQQRRTTNTTSTSAVSSIHNKNNNNTPLNNDKNSIQKELISSSRISSSRKNPSINEDKSFVHVVPSSALSSANNVIKNTYNMDKINHTSTNIISSPTSSCEISTSTSSCVLDGHAREPAPVDLVLDASNTNDCEYYKQKYEDSVIECSSLRDQYDRILAEFNTLQEEFNQSKIQHEQKENILHEEISSLRTSKREVISSYEAVLKNHHPHQNNSNLVNTVACIISILEYVLRPQYYHLIFDSMHRFYDLHVEPLVLWDRITHRICSFEYWYTRVFDSINLYIKSNPSTSIENLHTAVSSFSCAYDWGDPDHIVLFPTYKLDCNSTSLIKPRISFRKARHIGPYRAPALHQYIPRIRTFHHHLRTNTVKSTRSNNNHTDDTTSVLNDENPNNVFCTYSDDQTHHKDGTYEDEDNSEYGDSNQDDGEYCEDGGYFDGEEQDCYDNGGNDCSYDNGGCSYDDGPYADEY